MSILTSFNLFSASVRRFCLDVQSTYGLDFKWIDWLRVDIKTEIPTPPELLPILICLSERLIL